MTFAHRVVSGTVQLALSNGLVRVLSIVTMPILTGLLDPQTYGIASLVTTAISLTSVVALAGIETGYVRSYHSTRPPNGAGAEHLCWRFATMNALITGALGAAAWRFFSADFSIGPRNHLGIFVAAGTVLSVLCTMSQARALLIGKHGVLALTIVASGVIAALASIGLAVWLRDVVALLLPMLLAYLIPILLLGGPPIRSLTKRSSLPWNDAAALVKLGLAGVVTAPMFWFLTSSDRWFLLHYQGPDAVGVYTIGYSVGVVGMMVHTAVLSVWQPEATREFEEDPARAAMSLGRLMSRLIAAMAIMWLATTAAGGDIVRLLANERFHAAAGYVPYIAGGVFFYGVLRLATTGLLLARELKWSALWWLLGGFVSLILNLLLVPAYGGTGAAITQMIGFAFIAMGTLATAQARLHIELETVRLALIAPVVLAAGIWMSPSWHQIAAISLLLKLPVGTTVALAIAAVIAPDWCGKGVNYLRQRVCS